MSKFNENDFEQRLFKLKDSHDSIASLSNWCLSHVEHHGKIVSIWLGTLKKVKTEHRILLFYLANDIIQYSKKKGLAFVGTFAPALQKATTMVRDPNIRNKILRIFKIWDERNIYDETFLIDLSSLLTRGHKSANRIDLENFQPSLLYSRLKSCQNLEEDTDIKMKTLVENPMPLTDTEKLRTTLKNRKASEDVIAEIDEGIKKISAFISALGAEIKERSGLIELLDISEQYYEKEFGEAKVVSNAYKCFTNRVKSVKKKLDEKIDSLPSPVPTPSPTAPSPEPEPLDSSDERPGFEFTPGSSFMDGSLFSNQSMATEFENYYMATRGEEPPFKAALKNKGPEVQTPYSPESAYNGADSFEAPLPVPPVMVEPPVVPHEQLPVPVPPVPPINIPPVFNYFRPIHTQTTTPPPPPPLPAEVIPGLDHSMTSSHYNSGFHDTAGISDCSSEGLKIEVITSPSKDRQANLSTILESIVADTNTALPPPPAPPTMDFGIWSENADYWESPESPPLFEKEGLPAPSIGLGTDVDMRKKDVDHRNLISLTGNVEQDWDFPISNIEGENEDMEMSDEDVGKIEDINDSHIKPGNLSFNPPAFPILSIKPDMGHKEISEGVEVGFGNEGKAVYQTVSSIEVDKNRVPLNNVNNSSPGSSSFQLQPPPPPPPPMTQLPLNGNEAASVGHWANRFPPPPAPPFKVPPILPHYKTQGHQLPVFPNQGPTTHIRYDTPPMARGFNPAPPPPPPFPPMPPNNFDQFSPPSQVNYSSQEAGTPSTGFDRPGSSGVGQPIPSFETSPTTNQFDRSPRPAYFENSPKRFGFRPRFEQRNFSGQPFFRGRSPHRFPGQQFRSPRPPRFSNPRF